MLGWAVLAALLASRLTAADKVKLFQASPSNGSLTEISTTEVVLKLGSTEKKFAVNEIEWIQFDSEPGDLTQGRNAFRAGRYESALALLDKINTAKLERLEMIKDVEFYKASAAAHLALSGSGSKAEAGKKLLTFEKANESSFHYFEACETLGNLLAALNKPDQAETYFAKLAAAPWPDYKLRASVLMGRVLVERKEFDRAIARFDEVLSTQEASKEAERQKLAATLGKAAALAGNGKSEQAISSVEQVIAKADPENQELLARAYIILGNCYQAAGKKKEAVLAFLHVDLLFARFPEQHAEALSKLATLWTEVDQAERAAQARNTLKEKYPESEWAKK